MKKRSTRAKRAPTRAKPSNPAKRMEAVRRELARRAAQSVEREEQLLAAIKGRLPELDELLAEASGHWAYEDLVYRFYHQSWKVFDVQQQTLRIVDVLRSLMPDVPMNEWFQQIVKQGTGRRFKTEDNARWLDATRPMLEAFFHARYFLEMVCKYGRELDELPQPMPSGWAAVLYLYGLR